ncbi:hypothetical protein [uncultured Croceitalea sp.]|uniref:hypothetical protein n=1 Tax=uncultured Croceitalea sp. TaxID=1798908 RepID=UPI003306652C
MYYLKFLAEKHLESALDKGAIRIGTINYYRKIEDDTRQDTNEGLGEVIWKGHKLSMEDHNRIFTFTERIKMINGWSIENKGVPLKGSYPNFNVYTFCFSQSDNLEDSELERISGGKDSSYYFIEDLPEFVRILTKEIYRAGIDFINNNPTDVTPDLLKKVEVIDTVYAINYNDSSKARIVTEENVKTFHPSLLHPQDFFQKHTSFSSEQEIRIIWLFVLKDENGIKPINIPIPEIEHLDLITGKLPISRTAVKNGFKVKVSPLKNII